MPRADEGKGCAGCVFAALLGVAVFGVLNTILWVSHHRLPIVALFSVAALGWAGYDRWRRREHAPVKSASVPVPLADIKPGLVHTMGLIGVKDAPRRAPLDGPMCVFYRVSVEPLEGPEATHEIRSADVLTLEDGGGNEVVVHLANATWKLTHALELQSSPQDPRETVTQFLAERGLPHADPVRVRLEWIAPHELVFVRGTVTESRASDEGYRVSERARFVMESTPSSPVTIALEPIG